MEYGVWSGGRRGGMGRMVCEGWCVKEGLCVKGGVCEVCVCVCVCVDVWRGRCELECLSHQIISKLDIYETHIEILFLIERT